MGRKRSRNGGTYMATSRPTWIYDVPTSSTGPTAAIGTTSGDTSTGPRWSRPTLNGVRWTSTGTSAVNNSSSNRRRWRRGKTYYRPSTGPQSATRSFFVGPRHCEVQRQKFEHRAGEPVVRVPQPLRRRLPRSRVEAPLARRIVERLELPPEWGVAKPQLLPRQVQGLLPEAG